METMEQQILQLLGRYRVVVRPVLSLLTNDGSVPEAALTRLLRDGLVMRTRALPGNRSIYQLTRDGAAKAGVSAARSRAFRSQALFKHLGILLFCHVAGARRFRVEEAELQTLLGDQIPDGAHVMTLTNEVPVLLNIYVPGPRTGLRSIHRRLRDQLTTLRKVPALRTLLDQRSYGFGIVTETPERRRAILSLLRDCERDGSPPLAKRARVCVEALAEFDHLINGVRPAPVEESVAGASARAATESAGRNKPLRRHKPSAVLLDAENAPDDASFTARAQGRESARARDQS